MSLPIPRVILGLACLVPCLATGALGQAARSLDTALDLGQELPALLPGDRAPPLEHVRWLHGERVLGLQPGQVYVIDFWAPWCLPCTTRLPQLSQLALRYRDDGVTTVAVAIWPHEGTKEPAVYVQEHGAGMEFSVAEDVDGRTAAAWMQSAGFDGIPRTMIVDRDGRLAWAGHPDHGLDEALEQVVAGTFRLDDPRWRLTDQELDQRDSARRYQAAMPRFDALLEAVSRAGAVEDWEGVIRANEELSALHESFGTFRAGNYTPLLRLGRHAEATALVHEFIDGESDDPRNQALALSSLATSIALDREVADCDLGLALAAAERAVAIGTDVLPVCLVGLARVQYQRGEHGEALELLQQAVDASRSPLEKEQRTWLLVRYQAAIEKGLDPEAPGPPESPEP